MVKSIKKTWSSQPIPVNDRFRPVLCGTTLQDWVAQAASGDELIEKLGPTERNPLLSIGRYETRVVKDCATGVYFENSMPKLDPGDEDISRNLQSLWLRCD